jgi:hypothetical protein
LGWFLYLAYLALFFGCGIPYFKPVSAMQKAAVTSTAAFSEEEF